MPYRAAYFGPGTACGCDTRANQPSTARIWLHHKLIPPSVVGPRPEEWRYVCLHSWLYIVKRSPTELYAAKSLRILKSKCTRWAAQGYLSDIMRMRRALQGLRLRSRDAQESPWLLHEEENLTPGPEQTISSPWTRFLVCYRPGFSCRIWLGQYGSSQPSSFASRLAPGLCISQDYTGVGATLQRLTGR
jgi:hypothetical protein